MSGLREALARRMFEDACAEYDYEWEVEGPAFLAAADRELALLALPEHRDEVRALVGDERLRSLLLAVTPTRMGATPDLAWPDGYDGEDPWQQWEDDVMAALAPREEP